MKHFFQKRLKSIGILSLLMIGGATAQAFDFEVDGIFYNKIDDDSVAVTYEFYSPDNHGSYSGVVEIPEKISYSGHEYTVTSIGYNSFYLCNVTSVVIPNTITSIGERAFDNCGLTNVVIPNSVTSIGICAFNACYELESVEIPNSVVSIGGYAFSGCNRLKSVVIPNSVTSIEAGVFYNCNRLLNVVIPSTVTSIGVEAFSKCYELESVEIPNSVVSIGAQAFLGCDRLKSVVIPNSVTSIGDYAFYECWKLESIVFGNSVNSIGNYAFHGIDSLGEVTSEAMLPPMCSDNCFSESPISTAILYVPELAIESYKTTSPWCDFSIISKMEIPNDKFTTNDFEINKNETQTLTVNLNLSSPKSYSGFQFDVEMPEGLTITDVKLGDELVAAGFKMENSSTDNNPIRLISVESSNFKGVSVTESILTLTIKANQNATEGDKTIKFTNARLSTPGGTSIPLDDSSVTVTVKGVPVSSIEVVYSEGKQGNLYVNETAVYEVKVTPIDSSNKTVTWSIEDTSVASITTGDDNSKVTVKALKIGETTLKATANDGNGVVGTATIKVVATPITNVVISSQDNKTSIYPEEILTLTATVNPATATTPITYKWESDNPAVVTLGDNAASVTLTAVKTGTANISVTATNAAGNVTSEKFTITVAPRPIESVTIQEGTSMELQIGSISDLHATVNPSNATDVTLTWESDSPTVVKVENGKVTALTIGTAVITAKASNEAGSKTASITIEVRGVPASLIVLNKTNAALKVTETMTLTAEVAPANTTNKAITWLSSDPAVASVDNEGNVTAKAIGNATITATVTDTPTVKANCAISVSELILGDANDDGDVDVADIVTTALLATGLEPDNKSEFSSDINKNGEVDEQDIKLLTDLILGAVGTRSFMSFPTNILPSEDKMVLSLSKGENAFERNLSVSLTSSQAYATLRADITIPEGATVENISLGRKVANHRITYNTQNDGLIRVVIYSFDNTPFSYAENEIFNIKLGNMMTDAAIEMQNITATVINSQRYSLGAESDYAGIESVIGDNSISYQVFNLQGINVMNTDNAENLKKLEPGIYIINGQKVLLNK